MNELNQSFEENLNQSLHRLTDHISTENLAAKVMQRLHRRTIYRRLTAAGTVVAALVAVTFIMTVSNKTSPPLAADIDKIISRAGVSTELLLATQTLAQVPGGQELARENFQYLITQYPDTNAAHQADLQLQNLYNRRSIQ